MYREHALAYPNHRPNTCGGPETYSTTTISKKHGGKTSSGWQEGYIMKTHYEE